MITCAKCGNTNPDGAAFCDNCGASLQGGAAPGGIPPTAPVGMPPTPAAPVAPMAGGSACPKCGASVMAGQAYCESCGFALGSPPPPVQPPAAPPPAPAVPTYAPPAPAAPPMAPPVAPAAPAYSPPPQAAAMPPARLVVAGGAQIPLAGKTEYLLGREDAVSGNFPDVDLEPYNARTSGVGRKHAKIVAQGGYFLEDLKSVNGTWLNKQKLLPGQPMQLNNGDEIRLGTLPMNFYTS